MGDQDTDLLLPGWHDLNPIELSPRRPLVLNEPDTVWYIEAGSLSVSVSSARSGLPVGWRHRLFGASRGSLLFSIETDSVDQNLVLVAFSETAARLVPIPFDRVPACLSDLGLTISEATDSWVMGFSSLIGELVDPHKIERACERIPTAGRVTLTPGSQFDLPDDVTTWLKVVSGGIGFCGLSEISLASPTGPFPIATGLVIEPSTEQSEIEICTTTEHEFNGLTHFNRLACAYLKSYETRADSAERENFLLAERLDRNNLEDALNEVGDLLNKRPSRSPVRHTELLTAMAVVGEALGVEVREPEFSKKNEDQDYQVQQIARTSDLRVRKVLLKDGWWKDDCGALLGFLEDGKHPVALLRNKSGIYRIVDPRQQLDILIDEQSANLLALEAKVFSTPIPTNISNVSQIPRWAIKDVLPDIGFVVALSLLTTVIGMLVPQVTAVLMDTAIPDADGRFVIELALALFAAAFGVALFSIAQGIATIRFSVAANAKAQVAIFCHVLSLRVPFFRRFSGGDLLDRLMAISQVSEEFNSTTIRTLLTGLTTILNLGLLFHYNAKLALIALLLGLIVLGITVIGFSSIHKHYRVLMELQGRFKGFVFEIANAVGKIRIAGAQHRVFTLWMSRYTKQLALQLRAQRTEDYIDTLNHSVPLIGSILVYAAGASLFAQAALTGTGLTLGTFLAFSTAMATFLMGLTSMSNTVVELLDMLAKFNRIKPIIEAEKESARGGTDPGVLQGGISLSEVEFRYQEDGAMILAGIDLDIQPGKFVALVGPSGCGKSTIFRLLLGFERPDVGQVLFDGQDLDGLDIGSVRIQIGSVLQSAKINAGSILENISGSGSMDLDDVWMAVRDAGLEEDVEQMPMGLHTVISEGGGNISGGQKQRLLIARALVKKPRILLLDEATSALDNKTQAIVTASLNRRKVTRVAIAHRLSTIHGADQIIVMKQGRIDQVGSFQELTQQPGLFASMMAKQQA